MRARASYLTRAAAVTVTSLWACAALAQSAPERVASLFAAFQRHCGQAISAPQDYLNALPPQNSEGGPSSAPSPDGQVVMTSAQFGPHVVDAGSIGTPEGLIVECHSFDAYGYFDGIDGATLAALVEQHLTANNLAAVGGKLEQNGVSRFGESEYRYMVRYPLSGHTPRVNIDVADNEFDIFFENELHIPQ